MSVLQDKKSHAASRNGYRRVVLAETDESYRYWLVNELSESGYAPVIVDFYDDLVAELEADGKATVILSSEFDAAGPLVAFGRLQLDGFGQRVLVMTDHQIPNLVDRGMKMGIQGFVERSSDSSQVIKMLSAMTGTSRLRSSAGSPLLGVSPAMKELRALIKNVASTDAPVMIVGESGTGKELVARAIHQFSRRASEEFVPVNMAALPENLVESVLFGHEKGAFTGADSRREGLCTHAHKGTLFLDEIGEMNRELQPKLLRFLQEQTVQRIGSTRVDEVDVRIVSATNRNVRELVRQGTMREDLFFRLHVIPIHVPPLRDRKEDIPLLANAFLERKCQEMRRNMAFTSDVLKRLSEYSWPGNVRQLQNMIERIVVMATGNVIGMKLVPPEYFSVGCGNQCNQQPDTEVIANSEPYLNRKGRPLTRMQSAERRLIIDALNRHDGNVCAAADFLGLGQATIYRKLRVLEIQKSTLRRDIG